MKQSGRKRYLKPAQQRSLRREYAAYERHLACARRVAPKTLAVKYGVSPRTVVDYGRDRHKGRRNYVIAARR